MFDMLTTGKVTHCWKTLGGGECTEFTVPEAASNACSDERRRATILSIPARITHCKKEPACWKCHDVNFNVTTKIPVIVTELVVLLYLCSNSSGLI
jgi:hypothetical protein